MPLEYALQYRGLFPPANPWKYATTTNHFSLKPNELGIQALAKQTVRLATNKKFIFNLMLVGESGLGKTTFINTLFASDLLEKHQKKITGKTVAVNEHQFTLEENGVELELKIIDTPGFGDQMNRELGMKPIVEYIQKKYSKYFDMESAPAFRKDPRDPRVHAILYFINPNCHELKELDITALKLLSDKANVIPVIAKADTLTIEERMELKAKIINDLIKFDVKLYPGGYSEDREENVQFEPYVPFCVIGADTLIEKAGKKVRARKYRWGTVEVENEAHCDFVHLRNMLISNNIRDVIETCHNVHYFNFRVSKLRSLGRPVSILQSDEQFEGQIDSIRKQFSEEMARKEADIRESLFQRIKEKEVHMKQAEEALQRKAAEFENEIKDQMKQLEAEEKEIELAIQRNAASKKSKGW